MNSVVRPVCCGNQIIRVENKIIRVLEVLRRDRVNVMNQDSVMNVVAFNSQITTMIFCDYVLSKLLPLRGSIESLIEVSVKPKSWVPNRSWKLQVVETILKGFELTKLRI